MSNTPTKKNTIYYQTMGLGFLGTILAYNPNLMSKVSISQQSLTYAHFYVLKTTFQHSNQWFHQLVTSVDLELQRSVCLRSILDTRVLYIIVINSYNVIKNNSSLCIFCRIPKVTRSDAQIMIFQIKMKISLERGEFGS